MPVARGLALCSLFLFLIAVVVAVFLDGPGNGAKNLVRGLFTAPFWLSAVVRQAPHSSASISSESHEQLDAGNPKILEECRPPRSHPETAFWDVRTVTPQQRVRWKLEAQLEAQAGSSSWKLSH